MVYKLAEEDKLCGVIYPTYEGFKPIPKATCEMLESKCDKVVVEINCKGQTEEEAIENFKKVNKALLEGKLGKGYMVEITIEEPNKVGENYTGETINIEITTPSGKKVKRESPNTFEANIVMASL